MASTGAAGARHFNASRLCVSACCANPLAAPDFYYFRDNGGIEANVVIEQNRKLHLAEIKGDEWPLSGGRFVNFADVAKLARLFSAP